MARRRRWSEEERRELLATHAESGLSLWAFAAAAGVPYTTLVSWRRRAAGRARFVPVEVEPVVETAWAESDAAGGLEVVVGDAVVRVVAETDEALLRRVVRVLRSC